MDYTDLLNNWKQDALNELLQGMRQLFEGADEVMLEFAEKAESNEIQNQFFEARHELMVKQDRVVTTFHEALERTLLHFYQFSGTHVEIGAETLDLVRKDAFERALAIQTIADQAEKRNYALLYALSQRLSVVNRGRPVKVDDVPGHPHQLTEAFEQALQALFVEKQVQLALFTLFEQHVVNRVDDVLLTLDQALIEAGVLPNLRYTYKKHPPSRGGQSAATQEPLPGEEATGYFSEEPFQNPHAEALAALGSDPQPSPRRGYDNSVGDQTLGRIRELLSERRTVNQQRRSAPPAGGYASRAELSGVVSSTQLLEAAPFPDEVLLDATESRVTIDPELLRRIKDALIKQRQVIKTMVGRERLRDEDEDTIDIVGMLFEVMLNHDRLPNVVKALLSRLHTPYLKIAVQDVSFLRDEEHPARVLFELMVESGCRWVDESNLKTGIYPQFQSIVKRVVGTDTYDNSFFSELLLGLRKAIESLEQKSFSTQERTLEAEKGRMKLEQAKQNARDAVNRLCRSTGLPEQVEHFFDQVWTDYLTLIQLRVNADEQATQWKDAVDLTERTVAVATTPADVRGERLETLTDDIKQRVTSLIPHYAGEVDKFVRLLQSAPAPAAQPAFSPTTGLQRPKPKPAAPAAEASAPKAAAPRAAAADKRAAEPVSLEQKRLIRKLRELKPGTWLQMAEEDGEHRPVKLAWFNPKTEHFLFVDQLGKKVALKHATALAQDIENQRAFLMQSEKHFIGRALNGIRRLLEDSVSRG